MPSSESTTQALELALKMEKEGREFYLKAGQKSKNQLGQKLFRSLADAELEHMEKIKRIHTALTGNARWPEGDTSFVKGKLPRTVFAEALDNLGQLVKATSDDLEALRMGMDLENKSLLFYLDRSGQVTSGGERQFYQALVAEERGHYLLLFDSYEYLLDPQAYFIRKEHHGLDAGG
jgi:rubrerythrin